VGDADRRWDERLHALIGAGWPCPARTDFDAMLADVAATLRERGLADFELSLALRAMRGHVAIVADDVDRNTAFERFVEATSGIESLVAPASDGRSCFGIVLSSDSTESVAPTGEVSNHSASCSWTGAR
jgi:hypothetical protein